MAIPKGYQLHISSWENDGDFGATHICSGLQDVDDVKFVLAVCDKFKSEDDDKYPSCWGNSTVSYADIKTFMDGLLDTMKTSSSLRKRVTCGEQSPTGEDYFDGFIVELLGYQMEDTFGCYADDIDGVFCRVYSDHTLYYIPEQIEEVLSWML